MTAEQTAQEAPPIDRHSPREREIAAEQQQVDRVYARVDELRDSAAAAIEAGFLVADVGTFGALVERDALVHRASRRLRLLEAEHEGLVFGRLDLMDGPPRWIGRMGVLDDSYDPLVVDWRAPVAAPFYQATPAEPQGVRRRRVIRTSGATVTDVEDDLLVGDERAGDLHVIGDGALMAALTRARGTAMRDIVATIQAEQDRAVRAPASGVTTISGGPGTGKTAVATHRAAYLLYRDRRRFTGAGVLIVGPSPVFISYIERVLPSLGESSATLRELGSLLDGVVAERRGSPALAAVKGSLRMVELLARAVADVPATAPTELRVTHRGEVLRLSARQLTAVHRAVTRRRRPTNRLQSAARDRLLGALWSRRPDDVVWDRDTFTESVADLPAFIVALEGLWPVLSPGQVLARCADPVSLRRYGRDLLSPEEQQLLLAGWAEPGPSVADVALLDELRVLLGRPPAPKVVDDEPTEVAELGTVDSRAERPVFDRPEDYDSFGHVIVDESQDVSPMQWRMLGRRGPSASWTVVGDPAQSAWPDPVEAARARDAALPGRTRHNFALTTNYRNPREVFALAADVLHRVDPEAALPTAVRDAGVSPRLVQVSADRLVTEVVQEADALLAAVDGTVGVLCPPRLAAELRAATSHQAPERLSVLDALDAKGMEYDGVMVVEPDEIAGRSAPGMRTLYVALTRSTQRLTTVGTSQDWHVT